MIPDITEQVAILKRLNAIRDAARRTRLLEDDLPTGRYETDPHSSPPLKRRKKAGT